jgi:hypothetical protein
MSKLSARASAIKRLLAHLERSGLMERLELSDEDIADTIWLALQMGVVQAKTEDKQPNNKQERLLLKMGK